MNKILLNPGPTNTLDQVKEAQTKYSDVCHRTDEFLSLLCETKELILKAFGGKIDMSEWNVSIFGGSGTAAMESLISSLIDDITIVVAGKYGQRALEIMSVYNIKNETFHCENINQLSADDKKEKLYFVENETTTGEKFDLKKMVALYPNCKFYIDATSSFGASDYKKYLDKIDALSFCSNKCLQSTPGLGIVLWRKKLKTYRRNYYLNLEQYTKKLPFTLPVQSVAALNSSLKSKALFNSEKEFNDRRDKVIKDFRNIGIHCINKNPSNSIIGFIHPTKSYKALKQYLYNRNIIIYDGIKDVENSFRISTMSVLFDKKYSYILRCFDDSRLC